MVAEVLILHGWQNRRPDGHWQRWLAGELEATGAIVRYPQLPEPDEPVLDDWLRALDAELDGTDPDDLTVVAHSLGCLLWLAHAARRAERGEGAPLARRVVLVAPPAPDVVRGIPEIAAFEPTLDGATRDALTATAWERVTIVAGTEDPFCPEGAERTYAIPLDAEYVEVVDGGHLTIDDGYGPFPRVRDLVTR
ncbi:RBBP9/YdeN family alpha/beta hydrolase [Agromyces sp. NPDC057865]|uniref:RBBP9/YdeN family alpha/beta hydrolase n=1 Tax=Agromyces sp. NPDC057865 TaxID=3346267 RepID=UPI00366CDAFE